MGKFSKVVVCGMKGVGKTAILEQVIYGSITEKSVSFLQEMFISSRCNHFFKELHPTIEDIYVANVESDKGTREKIRFYDTAGIEFSQISTANGMTNQQLPRHYLLLADGYILVYDMSKSASLDVLISIKKDIDKNKDKKEVLM